MIFDSFFVEQLFLINSNEIRTNNPLVCKRTLNHLAKPVSLAKCLSFPLEIKWLSVQIYLLSLNLQMLVSIQATIECLYIA